MFVWIFFWTKNTSLKGFLVRNWVMNLPLQLEIFFAICITCHVQTKKLQVFECCFSQNTIKIIQNIGSLLDIAFSKSPRFQTCRFNCRFLLILSPRRKRSTCNWHFGGTSICLIFLFSVDSWKPLFSPFPGFLFVFSRFWKIFTTFLCYHLQKMRETVHFSFFCALYVLTF